MFHRSQCAERFPFFRFPTETGAESESGTPIHRLQTKRATSEGKTKPRIAPLIDLCYSGKKGEAIGNEKTCARRWHWRISILIGSVAVLAISPSVLFPPLKLVDECCVPVIVLGFNRCTENDEVQRSFQIGWVDYSVEECSEINKLFSSSYSVFQQRITLRHLLY